MACLFSCSGILNPQGYCENICFKQCPNVCKVTYELDSAGYPNPTVSYSSPLPSLPTSSPPPCPPPRIHQYWRSSGMIIAGSLIVTFFVCILVLLFFFCKRRANERGNGGLNPSLSFSARDNFVAEHPMQVIDHPIWHIRTFGLQDSLIESIPVFKYQKGENLVEGTDCYVCLNEFEDDEDLRLLPKCSHAFHLVCIDTWLRSHKNCPVCRAPVVASQNDASLSPRTTATAMESHIIDIGGSSSDDQEAVPEFRDSNGTSDRDLAENIDTEHVLMRRSLSLDSSAAQAIAQAVADKHLYAGKQARSLRGKRGDRKRASESLSFRNLIGNSSLTQSLQMRPSSVIRSLSSSGKSSSSSSGL